MTLPSSGYFFLSPLEAKEIGSTNLLIVAGDTLFSNDFQLSTYLETCEVDGDNVVYYELTDPAEVSKRGIIELDPHGVVKNFIEKPSPSETASRLACPAFYFLKNQSLALVSKFIEEKKDRPLVERDAPGMLIAWLQR
jgi:UTP-glucose-1-phosphate uridylyltransferase